MHEVDQHGADYCRQGLGDPPTNKDEVRSMLEAADKKAQEKRQGRRIATEPSEDSCLPDADTSHESSQNSESQTSDVQTGEDWEFLEEQLQVCMKNVRGLFPGSYGQLLEQERRSCGDPMRDQLPERLRKQTIADLIEFCEDSVQRCFVKTAVAQHTTKINDFISAECINMFEFAERMQLLSRPEKSDYSRPSSFKALTKRGMAEPRSKRRK